MLHSARPALAVASPQTLVVTGNYASVLILKAIGIWGVILVCAVLNGAVREAVLIPKLGNPVALALSGLLLSACILVLSFVLVPKLGRLQSRHCLYLGLFWLCLTLGFEFSFGRLLQHRSWSELLDAYTFKNGNLWRVVLGVTFIAPLVAVRLRGKT